MNDAKQATPAAELERQICSATEPKNEREWWAHREIERLRDRLSVETLALVETLARAEKAEAERDAMKALAVRWLRKWQSDMDPTPEMLDQTHALIGAALQEAER